MENKPTELRLVEGNSLSANLRKRIPAAEWMDNPLTWDKARFIQETSDHIYDTYGIVDDHNKHTLTMLADQIQTYVQCNIGLVGADLIISTNDGKTLAPNPLISIRDKTLTQVIRLMNELGLTPKSKLVKTNIRKESPVAKLAAGPMAR
jgi:phage terminase small subunit